MTPATQSATWTCQKTTSRAMKQALWLCMWTSFQMSEFWQESFTIHIRMHQPTKQEGPNFQPDLWASVAEKNIDTFPVLRTYKKKTHLMRAVSEFKTMTINDKGLRRSETWHKASPTLFWVSFSLLTLDQYCQKHFNSFKLKCFYVVICSGTMSYLGAKQNGG